MPKRSKKYSLLNNTVAREELLHDQRQQAIYQGHSQRQEVPYHQINDAIEESRQYFSRPPVNQSSFQKQLPPKQGYPNLSANREIEMAELSKSQLKKSSHTSQIRPQLQQSGYPSSSIQSAYHSPPYLPQSKMSTSSVLTGNSPPQNVFPMIVIQCDGCGCKQRIAGNISQFYCCQCRQINTKDPTFGVFICGVCRSYVVYQLNTSPQIRCHACHTVNRVPNVATSQIKQASILTDTKVKSTQEEAQVQSKKQEEEDREENIEESI